MISGGVQKNHQRRRSIQQHPEGVANLAYTMAGVSNSMATANNGTIPFHLTNPTAFQVQQQQQQQQRQQLTHRRCSSSSGVGLTGSMGEVLSESNSSVSPNLGSPRQLRTQPIIDTSLLRIGTSGLSVSPPVKSEHMLSPELHVLNTGNRQQRVTAAAGGISSPRLLDTITDDSVDPTVGTSSHTNTFHLYQQQQQQQQQQQYCVSKLSQRSASNGINPILHDGNVSGGTGPSSGDEQSLDSSDPLLGLGSSNASVPPMDMKMTSPLVDGGGRFLRYASSSGITAIPINGAPTGSSVIVNPGGGFQSMSMPVNTGLGVGLGNAGVTNEWFGSAVAPSLDIGSFPGLQPDSLQFSSGTGITPNINNGSGSGSTGDVPLIGNLFDPEEVQNAHRQAQMLYEKRRRRRESHNAVERRRRDNINEKIQELATLLPDGIPDPNNKPNKGAILRKSVDYIRQVQQMMTLQAKRTKELEEMVVQLQRDRGMEVGPTSMQQSLGTINTSLAAFSSIPAAPISPVDAMSPVTAMAPLSPISTVTPMSPITSIAAMNMAIVAPGTPFASAAPSITVGPVCATAFRSS